MVTFRILVLNPLLFSILAAVIFNYHRLVGADKALMKQVCQRAGEMSDLCMSCLEANPEAKNADKIGIATIIVTKCLTAISTTLASNMTSLATTTPDDVKATFNNCSNLYAQAGKDLNEAGEKLKSRDSDNAEKLITSALTDQVLCLDGINAIDTWDLPDSVHFEMKIYELLSDVALSVVDKKIKM